MSTEERGTTRELSVLRQLGAFWDGCDLVDIDQELARERRTARLKEVSPATVTRENPC